MLGEVPTRVTSPPKSEAKDIGISRRDGAVPVRRGARRATGIMMVRAPTFLVAIDSGATAATTAGTWSTRSSAAPAPGLTGGSTSPLRTQAALTTSSIAMIATTSLLKPSKALAAGTMPINTPNSS